jgi:hypothetical protein
LGEIANWLTLAAADRHKITLAYTARQHELEIKPGLGLPRSGSSPAGRT